MIRTTEHPPVGLSHDELQDWHLRKVEGLRAAKCMEEAEKADKPEEVAYFKAEMENASKALAALRTLSNERVGGCYFDAAGQAHAAMVS